jgi:hypothetical protein
MKMFWKKTVKSGDLFEQKQEFASREKDVFGGALAEVFEVVNVQIKTYANGKIELVTTASSRIKDLEDSYKLQIYAFLTGIIQGMQPEQNKEELVDSSTAAQGDNA